MSGMIRVTHPEVSCDMVSLMGLRAGQAGRVGDVLGKEDVVHRLREMGLHTGAEIQMIRPGCPCIIRLKDRRMGFRTDEFARVLVKLEPAVVS